MNFSRLLSNINKFRAPKSLNVRCFSSNVLYHERPNGNQIAFRRHVSDNLDNIGVVFCSGFQSNMDGAKGEALEKFCTEENLPFIRFDYQGCGLSSGDIRKLTLSDWKSDVLAVLDELTAGPQIIVGSSMGGLLMLHAALERPYRIKALVGVSTAADMPERFQSKQVLDDIAANGESVLSTEWDQYIITKALIDDLPKHSLLQGDTIPVTAPVALLHGMKDASVPYKVAVELAAKLQSTEVSVNLRKNATHRFSQPEDIELIFRAVRDVLQEDDQMRELAIRSFKAFSRYSQVPEAHVWKRAKTNRRVLPVTD